jgi:hypothetical protein
MRGLLAAALVASSCAPAATVPSGTAAAVPDAGSGVPDAGTPTAPPAVREVNPDAPYPGVAPPALLDPDTKTLFAVSPDGRHALVSNDVLRSCTNNPHSGPPCDPSYDIPFRLVTASSGSLALGIGGRSAVFSNDGRFIFVYGASGSFVAHADGTGLRPNRQFGSLGRWLYWLRNGDLVRQLDLDDEPSLVLALDGGSATLSPDGESIAYCHSSGGCFMQAPIGAPPLPIPPGMQNWDPGGKWLFVAPCTFIDLTGKSASVCDSVAPGTWAQRAGDTVAYFTAATAGIDLHVRNLATSTEVVFPGGGGWLSPDAGKVLRSIAESTDPAGPVTLLEAPSSGGAWTVLGSHVDRWSMSDDTRFVGMARLLTQPLISVDGTPGVSVDVPGLDLSGALPPRFEPKGGFGKAVFFEWDPGHMGLHSVIGNADGSGDWMRLPLGADCFEWQGHTALCFNGNVYAVRGEQAGLLARGLLPQGVKGYLVAPSGGKILFVVRPGGLWSVELPGP